MENRLTTLKTRTPEEGFDLAIKLSQKGVEKHSHLKQYEKSCGTEIFKEC